MSLKKILLNKGTNAALKKYSWNKIVKVNKEIKKDILKANIEANKMEELTVGNINSSITLKSKV